MATVTKPIALDESLNTTELSSRNVADVLAEELAKISGAISHIALPTTYDELSDLEDVSISSPTNGQYLQYDSVTNKWKNVNGGAVKTKQSSQLTFNISNYVGSADVATDIGIDATRIIGITTISVASMGIDSFSFVLSNGVIYLYTNAASGTKYATFLVQYI